MGVVEPRIVPKMNVSATTHGDRKDNAASNPIPNVPPTPPSTIGRNNETNFFKQFEHTRPTTSSATAPGGVAGMWLH